MMVNNKSPYLDLLPGLPPPPAADDAGTEDRLISATALWNLAEIQAIAGLNSDSKQTIVPITRKCRKDYKNLLENGHNIAELLAMLTGKHFLKSVWCRTSSAPGAWLPCDSYALKKVPFTHPDSGWSGTIDYYFKFCKNLNGTTALFVSIH